MDTYIVNSFCFCADVNNVVVGIHYLGAEEGGREEGRERGSEY